MASSSISSNHTCVICSRTAAHGWSSGLVNTGQAPLPESMSQPYSLSSQWMPLPGITPEVSVDCSASGSGCSNRGVATGTAISSGSGRDSSVCSVCENTSSCVCPQSSPHSSVCAAIVSSGSPAASAVVPSSDSAARSASSRASGFFAFISVMLPPP